MKLFLQKNAKFSSAGGYASTPPCLLRLGALAPNPQPPVVGGFASRPPLASGGWGLRPQKPNTAPPIANFWLRAWLVSRQNKNIEGKSSSGLLFTTKILTKLNPKCKIINVFSTKL